MLDQPELRRRIRAAMALVGVTSWEGLAERTPFSRSLLKDLGTERADIDVDKHLRPIAAALEVPYSWFTVPDLRATLADGEDPTLGERVEALEGQLAALRRRVDEQAEASSRLDARLREEAALRERAQLQRERQSGATGTSGALRRRGGEEQ